jgi:predicted GNAT family acetyltransferase
VLGLWGRLRYFWPAAREVRDDQPSMVIEHAPLVTADPRVRRSRPEEFDIVLPACVRMFTEEVGYSPVSGPGGPYETRVHGLIAQGRSFVRIDHPDGPGTGGDVVFKAELGAVAGGVAQVQGVWVAPDRRGERISEAGMAAVVQLARAEVAPLVSLYVNSYNARALATYRAVGFRQVGTYATVLF